MKGSIRRNSWIVTVPLAAAAVAYVTLSFLPERRATAEARQQIRQKQDYIVQAGGLAAVLRTAETELKRTRAYTAAWEQRAPAEGELSATYGKIHELAKAAGATVTRFDPEPAVHYETISQIPIKMGCVGSFAGICRFLEGVERLPLAIWEKEVAIKQNGQHEKDVSCELILAVFSNNSENYDYVGKSE
jgi:Tfp pilus assembly protein PilO